VVFAVRALLLLGLLCVLLPRGVAAAPTLLVLGDSISAAYGMSLDEGWVARLETRLRKTCTDCRVVNASISGDTSAGGLRRLPRLLERYAPDVLLLELGGNDGLRGYPTSQLRDNLSAMASAGRAAGARVLILPMEIPPNYGPRYTDAFRQAFAAAAQESGATLGPFPLADVATQPGLMQDDGIHPTASAQATIVDTVLPAVLELLNAPDAAP